ncbi:MAG TPA: hypothetical protein VGN07_18940 [Steroidobacteraceae bacterium]|jgi:hypothetical protein
MRIFQIARKPPQWLRVLLASLLLAFAINATAHAAHRHDATTTAAHLSTCGYSATFSGVGGVPQYSSAIEVVATTVCVCAPLADIGRIASPPQTRAQPRAPPAL